MKRIIINFEKLTPEILALVVEKYPEGYGKGDVMKFKNAAGETIEALEIKTEDTLYLVKVSRKLEAVMEDYDEDDYEDFDADDPDAIQDPDLGDEFDDED